MHSYDYAIVRVLPRVERGEQLNAGVILSCAAAGYLRARFELDEAALQCLAPGLDLEPIRAALAGIEARLRRWRGGRAARPAVAARALPLAGGAAQHQRAGLAGAHRALRRPGRGADDLMRKMVRRG